jgi:hypothetical protein
MKRNLLFTVIMLGSIMMSAQTFQWAKQFSGSSSVFGNSLAYSSAGELIVGGTFEGTIDFDPGEGTSYLTSYGGQDAFVAKISASGDLIWVKQFGGTANDLLRSVTCDAAGNVYLTGAFEGTADMDPGETTHNFTSLGDKDVYFVKLDENGDFVWAGQFGGAYAGTGTGFSMASSGNIYLTGYFIGNFDFDPGTSEYYMTATGQSIFVVKLNSNYELVWAKEMGGPLFDYSVSMALDQEENIYTTGLFKDVADFDPGEGTAYLTSAGLNDVFVSKLNSDGEYVWAKQMSGPDDEFGYAIVYDNNQFLYLTGIFKGTVDFAPDAGGLFLTSFGGGDIFNVKMDVDGNVSWAKQMGGAEEEGGFAVAVDNNNNVYVTGYFSGTADFDPGAETYEMTATGDFDIFVSKLNSEGSFVWAAEMGGEYFDRGLAIITDNQSNIYTTGLFNGTADFDPGPDNFDLTSAGDNDAYVSKLGTQLLSIPESISAVNVLVYPNPVREDFQIKFEETYSEIQVSIYNIQGQLVFNHDYHKAKNISVRLNGAPGLYFMQVATDESQTAWIKIIKK